MQAAHDEARNLTFPSPPEVVFKLLGLANNENIDFAQVAKIIAVDVNTTSVLISLANSAAYSGPTTVTNLSQAVRTIGIESTIATAISAALTASLGKSVRPRKIYRKVWLDAVLRAIIARKLTETLRPALCGEAYLVGLFQPMGVLALLANVRGYYELLEEAKGDPRKLLELEKEMCGRTNVEVLRELCEAWQLPSLISEPLLGRARPDTDKESDDTLFLSQVSYFLRSAPPLQGKIERVAPQLGSFAQLAFGLKADDIQTLLTESKSEFASTRSVFGSSLPKDIDGCNSMDQLAEAISHTIATGDWLNHAPVVVISRSKAQRMVVTSMLKNLGVRRVIDTASGLEALDLLDSLEPRLIISSRESSDIHSKDLWATLEKNTKPWDIHLLVICATTGDEEIASNPRARVMPITNHADTMWHAIHSLRTRVPAEL